MRITLHLFLFVFLFAAGPVFAEPESLGSALTPVPLRETSASVSLIDREQIERRGSPRLVDLLRTLPGVAVTESGPVGSVAQVRIRGAEGNHTLVVIDGVEANDPSNSSEFDFANLTTEQIERVEVIRGPLSGFYGSDSIGGVVHITTREGRPGLAISGSAEAGLYATHREGITLQMGGERWRQALSFQSLRTDGENAAQSGRERDGYKNLSIHARGGLTPIEALNFDYVVHWDDSKSEFDEQLFAGPAAGELVNAQNETDPRHLYARTQARLTLFEGRLTQRAGVSLTDTRRNNQANLDLVSSFRGRRVKLDYQVSGAESIGRLDVRGTAQYEREESQFRSITFPDTRVSPPSDTIHSAVGELRFGWDDRLFLNASLRQDFNRRFKDARTFRIGASTLMPGVPGLRFRGGFGKAVVNPTFQEIFGVPPFIPASPNLVPESSRGWDLGAEYSLPNALGVISLSVYRTRLSQEIVFAGPMFEAINLDRSRRQGVELEGRISPLAWLDVAASYGYARAEEQNGGRYVREVRRPRHSASLTLDARALSDRLSAQIGALYRGRANDFDFATFPSRRVGLDPVGLLHARVSYRVLPGLDVFVRGENLLDDGYQEVKNFQSPGIQALLGFRFRWDAEGAGNDPTEHP